MDLRDVVGDVILGTYSLGGEVIISLPFFLLLWEVVVVEEGAHQRRGRSL
jgi:hypothetical protein